MAEDKRRLSAQEIAEIVAEIDRAKSRGKFEAKGLGKYLDIRVKHHQSFQAMGKQFDDLAATTKEVRSAQGRGDKIKTQALEERARVQADNLVKAVIQMDQQLKNDPVIKGSMEKNERELSKLMIEAYAAGRKGLDLTKDEETLLNQFKEQAWKRRDGKTDARTQSYKNIPADESGQLARPATITSTGPTRHSSIRL